MVDGIFVLHVALEEGNSCLLIKYFHANCNVAFALGILYCSRCKYACFDLQRRKEYDKKRTRSLQPVSSTVAATGLIVDRSVNLTRRLCWVLQYNDGICKNVSAYHYSVCTVLRWRRIIWKFWSEWIPITGDQNRRCGVNQYRFSLFSSSYSKWELQAYCSQCHRYWLSLYIWSSARNGRIFFHKIKYSWRLPCSGRCRFRYHGAVTIFVSCFKLGNDGVVICWLLPALPVSSDVSTASGCNLVELFTSPQSRGDYYKYIRLWSAPACSVIAFLIDCWRTSINRGYIDTCGSGCS